MLERPCPECGFDSRTVAGPEIGAGCDANTAVWQRCSAARTSRPARRRPCGRRWSTPATSSTCTASSTPRLRLMLAEDDPLFANWDQDATAIADRYAEQDPATVAGELAAAAAASAARFDAVSRRPSGHAPGRRSDGAVFTVESLRALLRARLDPPPARRRRRGPVSDHEHDAPPRRPRPRARARRARARWPRAAGAAAAPAHAALARRGGAVDPALETSRRRHPGPAALVRRRWAPPRRCRRVVVVLSGSVALLGDTLHNVADALTAVPLGVAFTARPAGRRPAATPTATAGPRTSPASSSSLVIAASAALAAYEAIAPARRPAGRHHLGCVAAGRRSIGFARQRAGRPLPDPRSAARSARPRWSPTGCTPAPTASPRSAVCSARGGVALGWPWADPVVGLLITRGDPVRARATRPARSTGG